MPTLTQALCIALFAVSGIANALGEDCNGALVLPESNARPIPRSAVVSLSSSLTLNEIVGRLGRPVRDVGSGVFVLQWHLQDGSVFEASGMPCSVARQRVLPPPRISKP